MTLVGDTLRQFKQRLGELESQIAPLEAEAAELRAAIGKLEEASGARRSAPSKSRPRKRSTTKRASSTGGRRGRGEVRTAVLEAARKHPEATSGEIAEITGIARNTVATTMSKLRAAGELERRETS